MLCLQCESNPGWVAVANAHHTQILIDHAHCEKKAAGVALNLIFAYVDRGDLVRALSEIVDEELAHFRLVLDLLERRSIRFRRLPPSGYGRQLNELVRRQEPGKAIDRFLVAALIEARSCERFALLRDHVADRELAGFYGSLFESEARHYSTYVRFAQQFGAEDEVAERLDELARHEAQIIADSDGRPRMHS